MTSSPAQNNEADDASDNDLLAMQALFGEDYAQLCALYLADTPKRLAALGAAQAAADMKLATDVAHTLNGSCSSIGASHLAALCQDLEIACRNGNPAEVSQQLQAIETEYARIAAKLMPLLPK